MATIKENLASVSNFTLTLSALANSTAGVGRQATMVDNTTNLYLSALVSLNIKVGTTPAKATTVTPVKTTTAPVKTTTSPVRRVN